MLNNTAYDGDPLLLTAQHCIERESSAESAVFIFNYESPSCFGGDGSVDNVYFRVRVTLHWRQH